MSYPDLYRLTFDNGDSVAASNGASQLITDLAVARARALEVAREQHGTVTVHRLEHGPVIHCTSDGRVYPA